MYCALGAFLVPCVADSIGLRTKCHIRWSRSLGLFRGPLKKFFHFCLGLDTGFPPVHLISVILNKLAILIRNAY